MQKDRTYKVELLKGLLAGTRTIDDINAPNYFVLFPALPTPPCTKDNISPPLDAKFYDLISERYITEKEHSNLRNKYNGDKFIYITYDPQGDSNRNGNC